MHFFKKMNINIAVDTFSKRNEIFIAFFAVNGNSDKNKGILSFVKNIE